MFVYSLNSEVMSSKRKHHRRKSPLGPRGQFGDVTEVWLVCAPGEKTPKATWDAVNNATSKGRKVLSTNFKFHIPDLKIGTLDVLVGLLDDFSKLDPYVEGIMHKVIVAFHEILEEGWDKVKEHLNVYGMSIPHYLSKFQWDFAKFSIKQSLKNLGDLMAKQATYIDSELKVKMTAYNSVKNDLMNFERKQTFVFGYNIGTLLTCSLSDIVSKNDFLTADSKHLITVLVVVPRVMYTDFVSKYERLTTMVVPRSAKLIKEDSENGLFAVTLFQSTVDQFKARCRENKFVTLCHAAQLSCSATSAVCVGSFDAAFANHFGLLFVMRDFVFNEKEMAEEKLEYTRLLEEKKTQFDPLVRWLKVQFSEAFTAWIHVKALRVYVESVLRFGLPVNFQPVLVVPSKKTEKQLRVVLHHLFSYLDNSADPAGIDLSTVPGVLASAEYHPYVYYKISLDLVSGGGHHHH